MAIEIIPASRFTVQELVDLYNQTRVDYLIPMPMNAERLAEYIHLFDVDLSLSCVARAGEGQVLGLSMLGARPPWAWITRLGVIPANRRSGAGDALMDSMLACAQALGMKETHLEVIRNNVPAHRLFLKKDFKEATEYLVLRRAPRPVPEPVHCCTTWLDRDAALGALEAYPRHLTWITALASMRNAPDLSGLRVELSNGSSGWLVFRCHKFSLSHLVFHTEQGSPVKVGIQLLVNLYSRYPRHDTYAENIQVEDPHLPALFGMGFFDNFRRIEMRRKM
ncbi:MAG: GNAT family N-acetyltransferase [Chloroflexota bacterium]